MSTLLQDLRYAVRQLFRSPGFTLVAVLTLALGIGVNTLIFSFVEAVLIRPLPFAESERVMALQEVNPSKGYQVPLSYPDFLDWRAGSHSFSAMAAYSSESFNLSGSDRPEHVEGISVSSNLFPLLGVRPSLGRGFRPEEEREGGSPVVVLSHELWTSHFAADSSILGRTVRLDGAPHTVIGVMPEGFGFPDRARLWVPLHASPSESRSSYRLSAVGRLKPGVSRKAATEELNVIARELAAEYPKSNTGWQASVVPFREAEVGNSDTVLYLMMGAVGFVLLIACANLASLLLARATVRQREIAVRTALGARKGRVVRLLLTESVLLALLGAAVGVFLALWGVSAINAAFPASDTPLWLRLTINGRVLAFTLAIAAGTGLLFGIIPALRAARTDIQAILKSGGRGTSGSRERGRLRDALVATEVALSMVLLIGAGLMIRSFLELQRVEPGFDGTGVVTMRVSLAGDRYDDIGTRVAFWAHLLPRVEALPGIESASATPTLPLDGGVYTTAVDVEGKPRPEGGELSAAFIPVAGSYLQSLQIPLLRGRWFTPAEMADTAARAALVSEATAQRLWPGEDPLGKRFSRLAAGDTTAPYRVVGVVGDVQYRALDDKRPENQLYLPYATAPYRSVTLIARTSADPAGAIRAIRGVLAEADPALPVYNVRTMDEILRRSVWSQRLLTTLFGGFAAIALLLAMVGVYSVMSYLVAQRTHDIGVRLALGAEAGDVLRQVLRRGVVVGAVGIGAGLVGAWALARVMSSILYGVQPTDPATFASVPLLLFAVALLANYIPARRATRVDPVVALRAE